MITPDDVPLIIHDYEDTRPKEWKNLPDDEVTACGVPLGQVWPELYDENNQPRDAE